MRFVSFLHGNMRSFTKVIISCTLLLHNLFSQFDTTDAVTATESTSPSQKRLPVLGTARECQCMEWYYCDIRNYYLDEKKKCENQEFISCCERPSIKKLPSLVADCGLVHEQKGADVTETLKRSIISNNISNVEATYGNDPWNVALYRKRVGGANEPILICSGTLVSPTLVVTVAACFYDQKQNKIQNDTSLYEIYVGKFTRNYDTRDSGSQKIHKIKKLITYSKSYSPRLTGIYGSNIILIALEEPVAVDKYVRPICLDWSGIIFGSLIDKKVRGRVVSWGSTTTDNSSPSFSDYLLTNDMPYIDYNSCLGQLRHLPQDNFCAGTPSSPGGRRGAMGASFVSKYKDRYFLRGLASSRDKDGDNFIAAYTDLDSYTSWIRENL